MQYACMAICSFYTVESRAGEAYLENATEEATRSIHNQRIVTMNLQKHASRWLPALLLLLAIPAFSAENRDSTALQPVDTVSFTQWAAEIRPGLLEGEHLDGVVAGTIELRYHLSPWVSVDGAYITELPAIHFGVSVYPFPIVYLQGSIGQSFMREISVIWMRTFEQEFSFAIRGGLRATIGEWLTVSFGAGSFNLVDTDYCPTCNNFDPIETTTEPVYTSVRSYGLWEIGIGLTW